MDKDDPRQRLLAVAGQLYRVGGISGLTTDALAQAAGTSKRAIYQHFSGRDEILETLFMARLHRLEVDLQAIEASTLPIREKIKRFSEIVAVVPQDFPVGFWTEFQRAAPLVADRIRQRRKDIAHQGLHRLFSAGVESRDIRRDIPIPLLLTVVETLSEHLLSAEIPVGHSLFSLAEAGIAVLFDGLLSRPQTQGDHHGT